MRITLKAILFSFILLSVSCGKDATGKRCFTQDEAILYCQAEQISTLPVTLETARLICEPRYPAEACYHL